MTINAKPFSIAEKIRKRIFYGKPNVYAHVDINQSTDVDVYALDSIASRLGGNISVDAITGTFIYTNNEAGNSYSLEYTIANATSGVKVYHKNIAFDLPTFSLSNVGTPLVTSSPALLNLYLIAKLKTVTFADDNVMAGVDGTGFTAPIASSDAQVYELERVELTQEGTLPTLGSGEQIICKIASVNYIKKDWVGDSNVDIYEPILVKDVPYLADLTTYLNVDPNTMSTPDSTLSFIGRISLLIKKMATKLALFKMTNVVADDVLVYNTTDNKFANMSIFNFIRNYAHTFTKVQSWGGGHTATISGPTTARIIEIPDTGNYFIVNFGTAQDYDENLFADIKKKIDTTLYDLPTGTIVTLFFNMPNAGTVSDEPALLGNFRLAYRVNQTTNLNYSGYQNIEGTSDGSTRPFYLTHGDTIMFQKTNTEWIILSHFNEHKRQLQKLQEVVNTKLTNLKTAWISVGTGGSTPALGTDWTLLSGPFRFRLDSEGNLQFSGVVQAGLASANVIFTLPVGYRPASTVFFSVGGGIGNQNFAGQIGTNGNVEISTSRTTGDILTFTSLIVPLD